MVIRNSEFIKYEGNMNYVRYEIDVDTVAELPETIEEGSVIAQGSIAWVISTGEFYGMTSEGSWVNQTATSGGSDDE